MIINFIYVFFALTCVWAKHDEYKGHKVYSIEITSKAQLDNFDLLRNDLVDFWRFPNLQLKKPGYAMVPASHQEWFEDTLEQIDVPVIVHIPDVAEFLVNKENEDNKQLNQKLHQILSRKSVGRAYDLTQYLRYDEILDYVQGLEEEYATSPTISVEIVESGTTFQSRQLFYLKITSRSISETKPTIVIDAASSAREWITVPSAMYVVDMLLEEEQFSLLEEFEWIIIPVLNPDGYEFSHTNTRLWIKSRRTNVLPFICVGVNINRNFDIDFGNFDSSANICGDTYPGGSAFSEPESQVVQSIVEGYGDRIKLYISLQNKGGFITYPWNYERAASGLFREHHLLSLSMVDSMSGNYTVGVSSVAIQRASGTSADYVRRNGVRYTFNLDIHFDIVIPVQEIPEIVEDVWSGVSVAARGIVY